MGADAIRKATPADYDAIVTVVNDWWGRDVLAGLPRLFLDHFYTTSLIAEHDGEMTGFLIVSGTFCDECLDALPRGDDEGS
jgi:hypothetical protein